MQPNNQFNSELIAWIKYLYGDLEVSKNDKKFAALKDLIECCETLLKQEAELVEILDKLHIDTEPEDSESKTQNEVNLANIIKKIKDSIRSIKMHSQDKDLGEEEKKLLANANEKMLKAFNNQGLKGDEKFYKFVAIFVDLAKKLIENKNESQEHIKNKLLLEEVKQHYPHCLSLLEKFISLRYAMIQYVECVVEFMNTDFETKDDNVKHNERNITWHPHHNLPNIPEAQEPMEKRKKNQDSWGNIVEPSPYVQKMTHAWHAMEQSYQHFVKKMNEFKKEASTHTTEELAGVYELLEKNMSKVEKRLVPLCNIANALVSIFMNDERKARESYSSSFGGKSPV